MSKPRKRSKKHTKKNSQMTGPSDTTKTATSYGFGVKSRTRARSKRRIDIAPYKSQYEYKVSRHLEEEGINFLYEPEKIPYVYPIKNSICIDCGGRNAGRRATYTPDFYLTDYDLWIETKGKWDSAGRTKILSVLESDNKLTKDNFRMLFMYDNWLTSNKKQRYVAWCVSQEIVAAAGDVLPLEWLK